MRWIATLGGRILLILLVVVLGLLTWAGIAYAADRAVEADVVDKRCGVINGGEIVAKTRLFGTKHTSRVDAAGCGAVPIGAYVRYHVRSQRTLVYEFEGGPCLWDSAGLCR